MQSLVQPENAFYIGSKATVELMGKVLKDGTSTASMALEFASRS